jgi:hypothetical protein
MNRLAMALGATLLVVADCQHVSFDPPLSSNKIAITVD